MPILSSSYFLFPSQGIDLLINSLLGLYSVTLTSLFVFGIHSFVMLYYHRRRRNDAPLSPPLPAHLPVVTVQVPLYNEKYVALRVIDAVSSLTYPREKLEIQILDDSTDETSRMVAGAVGQYRDQGFDIHHVRRSDRAGYKAGALRNGLQSARGEFIALFDADFVPRPEFLLDTIPYFSDPAVGVVQSRWEHINRDYSMLTRAQAFALDGHFVMEQSVRNRSGFFITFNGTGGIWRAASILDAGNWQGDTLTEDIDLSYRAQLKGWKFVFLNDITTPAELPVDIASLRAQQFRWAKGTIETAKKLLPLVWMSRYPISVKAQATAHLTGHLAFPIILLAGVLNAPLAFVRESGGHDVYFSMLSLFALAFGGAFLFHLHAQREIRTDWKRRMLLFPVVLAGSMGFALNNTRAVLEGLFGIRSPFVRTPKFAVRGVKDTWKEKEYALSRLDRIVIAEIVIAIYCFFGVVSSLYRLDAAAVPFQLLYAVGFSAVAWLSVVHSRSVRRSHPQAS